MPNQERRDACPIPPIPKRQADQPRRVIPKPEVTGIDGKNPIQRSIGIGTSPGITVVTYSFSAPEYSIGQERRVVELNPNFQNRCILE